MSVSSVRGAISKAVADKKVTYSEAKEIVRVASRTSGINAGERAELEKLSKSKSVDTSAKGVLERAVARATPGELGEAATRDAVKRIVQEHGLDTLTGLKSIDSDKLGPAVMASLERFSAVLDVNDGDTVAYTARELRAGKEKVIVVSDFNGEKKELYGFFDAKGRELARASATFEEEKITMRWEGLDGKPGASIATYDKAKEKIPTEFKRDLITWLKGLEERPEGKEVANSQLPANLRRRFEYMERTIADGTSAETLSFQGRKLYLLNDWSCVSSQHLYTEKGTKLATLVDGEVM